MSRPNVTLPFDIQTFVGPVGEYADAAADIYRAAYTAPPFEVDENDVRRFARETWPTMTADVNFRLAFAWADEKPVGMAYGVPTKADTQSARMLATHLGTLADDWLPNSFQFWDLAVVPDFQGKGLGGALHNSLLSIVSQPRALLYTLEASTPALRLYLREDWVFLAHNVRQYSEKDYAVLGKIL